MSQHKRFAFAKHQQQNRPSATCRCLNRLNRLNRLQTLERNASRACVGLARIKDLSAQHFESISQLSVPLPAGQPG